MRRRRCASPGPPAVPPCSTARRMSGERRRVSVLRGMAHEHGRRRPRARLTNKDSLQQLCAAGPAAGGRCGVSLAGRQCKTEDGTWFPLLAWSHARVAASSRRADGPRKRRWNVPLVLPNSKFAPTSVAALRPGVCCSRAPLFVPGLAAGGKMQHLAPARAPGPIEHWDSVQRVRNRSPAQWQQLLEWCCAEGALRTALPRDSEPA